MDEQLLLSGHHDGQQLFRHDDCGVQGQNDDDDCLNDGSLHDDVHHGVPLQCDVHCDELLHDAHHVLPLHDGLQRGQHDGDHYGAPLHCDVHGDELLHDGFHGGHDYHGVLLSVIQLYVTALLSHMDPHDLHAPRCDDDALHAYDHVHDRDDHDVPGHVHASQGPLEAVAQYFLYASAEKAKLDHPVSAFLQTILFLNFSYLVNLFQSYLEKIEMMT